LFGCIYGLSFVFIPEKVNIFNDKNLYFFPFKKKRYYVVVVITLILSMLKGFMPASA